MKMIVVYGKKDEALLAATPPEGIEPPMWVVAAEERPYYMAYGHVGWHEAEILAVYEWSAPTAVWAATLMRDHGKVWAAILEDEDLTELQDQVRLVLKRDGSITNPVTDLIWVGRAFLASQIMIVEVME